MVLVNGSLFTIPSMQTLLALLAMVTLICRWLGLVSRLTTASNACVVMVRVNILGPGHITAPCLVTPVFHMTLFY